MVEGGEGGGAVNASRHRFLQVGPVSSAPRSGPGSWAYSPSPPVVGASARLWVCLASVASQPLEPPPLPFGGCGFVVDFTAHRPLLELEASDLDDLLVLLGEVPDLAR